MIGVNRKEILEEANKCVNGQREQEYGTPENNFGLIARLWNEYLGPQSSINAVDVSMMMALLKIARVKNGMGTTDCFIDIAGYAACGGELNSKLIHPVANNDTEEAVTLKKIKDNF